MGLFDIIKPLSTLYAMQSINPFNFEIQKTFGNADNQTWADR